MAEIRDCFRSSADHDAARLRADSFGSFKNICQMLGTLLTLDDVILESVGWDATSAQVANFFGQERGAAAAAEAADAEAAAAAEAADAEAADAASGPPLGMFI